MTGQCFVLQFLNPYQSQANNDAYKPLNPSRSPSCTPVEAGYQGQSNFTMSCQIVPGTSDQLKFQFNSFSTTTTPGEGNQAESLTFIMTNFLNPFSSTTVKMQLRNYQDANCKSNQIATDFNGQEFDRTPLPSKNVELSSTSNQVAYSQNDNNLIIAVKPVSAWPPSYQGTFMVNLPYWYYIGNGSKKDQMFSSGSNQLNYCFSKQVTVISSTVANNILTINWQSNSTLGLLEPVTLSCPGFKNPIYPGLISGFGLTVCDSEGSNNQGSVKECNVISATIEPLVFDATTFSPVILSPFNFKVGQGSSVVGTFSQWQISLNLPVPLSTECYLQFYLPNDLGYNPQILQASKILLPKSKQQTITTQGITTLDPEPEDPWKRKSIVFSGCWDEKSLGDSPSGQLVYSQMRMPVMVKDSQPFGLRIFKDQARTQLIFSMINGTIISQTKISPGVIIGMSLTAQETKVQSLTSVIVSFNTTHVLNTGSVVIITMPANMTLPPIDQDFTVQRMNGNTPTLLKARVSAGNRITIYNVLDDFETQPDSYPFKLVIPGVLLQRSALDAGPWSIVTQALFTDGQTYTVDNSASTTSLTAIAGDVYGIGEVIVTNPITQGKQSLYTLTFDAQDDIPAGGAIQVIIPPQLQVTSQTGGVGTCSTQNCEIVQVQSLKVMSPDTGLLQRQIVGVQAINYPQQNGVNKKTQITISIGGLLNPRSLKPTEGFIVTTCEDAQCTRMIDIGYNKTATMTVLQTLDQFNVQQTNFTNGVENSYIFSIQSQIPFAKGDMIYYQFPPQIRPPQSQNACEPGSNVVKISCQITGQQVILAIEDVIELTQTATYGWIVKNVQNPPSTQPSGSFQNIMIKDSQGFSVTEYTQKTQLITNKFPGVITKSSLAQQDLSQDALTTYTIQFIPQNAIPTSGSIQLTYPQQLDLPNKEQKCAVTTYQTFTENCEIDKVNRIIIISKVFPDSTTYSGNITIQISDMKNPPNNKNIGSFTIKTYADLSQTYQIDILNNLTPIIQCDFPCKTCDKDNRKNCNSCWMDSPADQQYLQSKTCESSCRLGFSSNAATSDAKVCYPCDDSCLNCFDSDVKECVECNPPKFPFRLTQSNFCFAQCGLGLFQSTDSTCTKCLKPCMGCFGTESNCTVCDANSTKPALYNNQCIEKCPSGYTLVGGVCTACTTPCSQCSGQPDFCTSCDNSNNKTFVFNGACYETCPPGSTPNATNSECIGCPESGCSLCDLGNLTNCLLCQENLFSFNGTCQSACPKGFVVNESKTACRSAQLSDLGMLYFPWLIAAFIFILVVIFGQLRKQPKLVKGIAKLKSDQNTVTAILVVLSPLQTLAALLQGILGILYGVYLHAALAFAAVFCIIIMNIAFQCQFTRKFNSKILPADRKKLLDQKKITPEKARQYETDADPKFANYLKINKKMWCPITTFSIISNWKINKLYYSHLYNYDIFQAPFTDGKGYLSMLKCYSLAYLFLVDLNLICIGIAGVVQIQWGNQLFITFIETMVISLLNIIFTAVDLFLLDKNLAYTMESKQTNVRGGFDDDSDKIGKDEREKLFFGLIQKVKGNKLIFLNNKLDELLCQFGDRRCKSMIDFNTGWLKEEDPRKTITWPISPRTWDEYKDMDIKFTKEDAYGVPDNVYADAVSKPKGKEKGMQGDAAQVEFQDALNRKHGDMMSMMEDNVDEQRRLKGKHRRGRKNKYHKQIDNEDDEEAEHVEPSDDELRKHDLQIIREQEEEEENLRKQVEREKAQQTQQAAEKKAMFEQQQRQKLELEKAEEESRRQKALLEEAERKAKAELEARQQLEAELKRIKLEQETIMEQAKKEQQQRQEMMSKASMSEQARMEYEQNELIRQRQESERMAKEKSLAEERERELLKQLAEEKQKAIEAALIAQELRDKQALSEKQAAIKKEEYEREQIKTAASQKKKEEADKKKAAENAEKEEKKRQEEELLKKKEKEKEQKKTSEEAEKQKKLKEKEDKAKKDAEDKQKKKPSEPEPVPKKVSNPDNKNVVNKDKEGPKSPTQASQLTKQKSVEKVTKADPAKQEKPAEAVSKLSMIENVKKEQPQQQLASNQVVPGKQPEIKEEFIIAPTKQDSNRTANDTIVNVTDNLLKDFRQDDKPIQIPPDNQLRLFNENDILGDLDRDEKGNVVVLLDNQGKNKDRAGKITNKRGYLIDSNSGAVLENLTFKEMFPYDDLDDRGEVPHPYCVERYNFNPHNVMGDFDYIDGQPRMMVTNKGFFVDKKGRRVNKFGWMVNQGHLMDRLGRKKLDKKQLTPEGDIPKLFTLQGKRYDIRDVMGQFEKDQLGRIISHTSKNGKDLLDSLGRRVNDKGYLIDNKGNIIDSNNKVLFTFASLKSGEFIKIFPFTKFNLKRVQGDYDMNSSGNPILVKHKDGTQRDKKSRLVNKRGYLIDNSGNVIDDRGKLMFDLCVLEDDGEIPSVFRTGLLKNDTNSELSRLMDEIEKQPSDYNRREENKNPDTVIRGEGDTSIDSKMEDTPANYNLPNQRFPEDEDVDPIPEDDENAEHMAPSEFDENGRQILPKKKKPKKKKKKPTTTIIEFLQPTDRELNMAGAYGGQARGQIRRPGIKYEKDRLQGSKKFRVSTADEPKVRAQLEHLANSVSGFGQERQPPKPRVQGLMNGTNGFDSNEGKSDRDPSRMNGPDAQARVHPEKKKGLKDGDFEQMFGKDIDQFLEDSEWDIESQFEDKVSHNSNPSNQPNDPKLKAMEKLYLQRLEAQPGQNSSTEPRKKKKPQKSPRQTRQIDSIQYEQKKPKYPKIKPERETIISFTDDPGVIHRGEILPFLTKQKKDEIPARGPSALGIGGIPMMKEKSSKGSPERF